MAKALVALIVSLCLAFPAAAAQSQDSKKKQKPVRPAWSELTPPGLKSWFASRRKQRRVNIN